MKDHDGENFAKWGTVVEGVRLKNGFVRTGKRFLPIILKGETVLRLQQ
jgi:hypothetical protein